MNAPYHLRLKDLLIHELFFKKYLWDCLVQPVRKKVFLARS